MNLKSIELSDIRVGSPLLWDVYDNDRKLLLKKGKVVESREQLKEMAERGLLIEAHLAENLMRTRPSTHPGAISRPEVAKPKEKPSVLRMIHSATKRLERLLYGLQAESNAQAGLLEVAKVVTSAAQMNADIALASVMLHQDDSHYSVRHGIDTAILASLVAHRMQIPAEEITSMAAAALTMNVGMLRQLDIFLNKLTPLTELERHGILTHPKVGVDMLRDAGITDEVWLSHVLMHHENEDGSGYPAGKEVKSLPPTTKILSFADRYCACVSVRQYRRTHLPNAALREALFANGKPRDPMLAAYFVKELTNMPPGSLVKLHSGEIGVVTTRPVDGHATAVKAFIGARGEPLSIPLQRDTGKPNLAIVEPVSREHAMLRFSMHQLWGDEAAL